MTAYATVADLQAEGLSTARPGVNAARLQLALDRATLLVEQITGRFFEPRPMVLELDGDGSPVVFVEHPIVAIDRVELADPFSGGAYVESSPTSFIVYNRHLTDRLAQPDDRDNPRVEFIQPSSPVFGVGAFPPRQKSARLVGTFGYTDRVASFVGAAGVSLTFADANPDTITRSAGSWIADGFAVGQAIQVRGTVSNDGRYTVTAVTATVLTLTAIADALTAEVVAFDDSSVKVWSHGATPDLIKWATAAIAARQFLARLGPDDRAERTDELARHRVASVNSRGRGMSFEGENRRGGLTGDPEIDAILANYRRPPRVGRIGGPRYRAERRPIY